MTTDNIARPRGEYLCTCGHLRSDHKPICTCVCPAFERGEFLRACGHLPDDDPCPRARRKRSGRPHRRRLPFRKVWDRDGWQCVRCGTHENLTVDHILSRWPAGGGDPDALSNLQTLCGTCNSRKGARLETGQ